MKNSYTWLACILAVLIFNTCQASLATDESEQSNHNIHIFEDPAPNTEQTVDELVCQQFDRLERVIKLANEGKSQSGWSYDTPNMSMEALSSFLGSDRLKQLTSTAGAAEHDYLCSDDSQVCSYYITFTLFNSVVLHQSHPDQIAIVLHVHDKAIEWSAFKTQFYTASKGLCPACDVPEEAAEPRSTYNQFIENARYYGGLFGAPLLKFLSLGYIHGDNKMLPGSNIRDHMTNNDMLSANLQLGESIPQFIGDHNLTVTTPELDGALVTYAWGVGESALMGDGLSINKKELTVGELRRVYIEKAAANMLTKQLNRYHFETTYANETVKSTRQAKAAARTSVEISAPFALKHFILGSKYDGNMIVTIPCEHLLSCAVSNIATPFQIINHNLLGELDLQVQPANSEHIAQKALNGLSHLLTAGEFLAVGSIMVVFDPLLKRYVYYTPYIIISTVGKHVVKGSGYLVMDAGTTNLIANEVEPWKVNTAVSLTSFAADNALFHLAAYMKVSRTVHGQALHRVLSAMVPGYGNRYAKYSIRTIAVTIFSILTIASSFVAL